MNLETPSARRRRWAKAALVFLALSGVFGLLMWDLATWSRKQTQMESQAILSPLPTATLPGTTSPGWWDSPLDMPTEEPISPE